MFIEGQKQKNQSFIHSKANFPTIYSPQHRGKNKSLDSQYEVSKTLTPRSLEKSNNKDQISREEKVVTNFLAKYLMRKEQHQIKLNGLLGLQSIKRESSQKRIDPRFRRIYLKKLKHQKPDPICRFLIGNQERYSLFLGRKVDIQLVQDRRTIDR